ncbi:MAG TPA: MBL fold metallo-hydrolase [Conexibacter sp.]|jgi:hydroxyacylglutathione hydrolase|nr:MBL fold metallo-hydrolase [Conexibacter sp.]
MPKAARPDPAATEEVARRYFAAVAAREVEAMVACWRGGGVDRLHGQAELVAPDGVRAWFEELFAAVPDAAMEVVQTTTEGDRCAVRWRMTGTFAGPGTWQGLVPTGGQLDLEGCDVVQVADELVVGNEAYVDGMTIARQLGVLPPRDSGAERGLTALTNLRTRLARRFAAGDPEPIADGVWVVRGGFPRRVMNVYLLRDGDGVLLFDAGVQSMTPALAAIGAQMGGITRVVLGHGHADHRGAAPGLGAPVWCHPDEVADAEGDGGMHYFDLTALDRHGKLLLRRLLPIWDGGPVQVASTVSEGDEVAGFSVVHLPGHAPGLIGLWRESDRLALVSDCFYTLDPQTGIPGAPRVPHRAFNKDTEQARASMRKLAALAPATAWCGHAEPLRGDVAGQLEHAAATT